jgi:hypothetical protein
VLSATVAAMMTGKPSAAQKPFNASAEREKLKITLYVLALS